MTKNKTCITKSFYFFLTLSLVALLSTTLWSAPRKSDQAQPGHVIIQIKKAEIKSAPNPASNILEIAFKGEIFKVLHELPDWYLIQLSSGKEGYLSKKYARVKVLDNSKKARPIVSKPARKEIADNYILIISSGSFIRTSPQAESKVIAQAKLDNAFKLNKKISTSWYEIILSNGKKGYVPAAITKIINSADLAKLKARRKSAAVPKPKTQPQPESQPQLQPVVVPQFQPALVPQPEPVLYAVAMMNDIILRQEPNISSKIMVTAKQGDHYKIISQEGIWCSVSLPDGQQAFVLSKVIRIVKEPELTAAVTEATKAARQVKLKTVSVTDKVAKLRAKASTASKVITTAPQGTVFKLVWVYKDWYEVLTSSGTAFISDKSAKLVNEKEIEAPAESAIENPAPVPPKPEQPVIAPPAEEKPAIETKPETETKPAARKPAIQDEDAWLRDKYVLVTTNMVNVREAADKKSRILARANTDTTYKLLARHNGWYEIFLPPDQNAFIAAGLTEVITEVDLLAGPKKWEETRLAKQQETARLAAEAKTRKLAEEKARKEEALKAKLENEKKIKEDSERRANEAKAKELEWLKDKYVLITVKKAVLQKAPNIKGKIIATVNIDDTYKLVSRAKDWYEVNFSTGTAYLNHNLGIILSETALAGHKQKLAEEKIRKEEELKAKLVNERKVKEESDRRAKEAAELKAKQEAERKAKLETEKAKEQDWLRDKYTFINKKNINLRKAPVKTAPVIAQAKTGESFKLVSRTKEWYEVSLATGTAFIASNLAEVLTDKELEAKRTFEKESAEAKAQQRREAQELKERQEAAAKALDELWCKDKYIVIMADNSNLRSEPSVKAKIISSAKKSDIFKLLARGKEWYEIFLPPDQNAFVTIALVDILTEGEVVSRIKKEQEPILRKQREAEALAKRQEAERLATAAKVKKEAEEKALKIRAAEELKARQAAELKAKQENEKKIKEEAERRAKETAEQKAKEEAEFKAKEIEWLKDKYILVEKKAGFLPAPNKKAAPSGSALADTSYKIVTRTSEWYGVDTSSGTAFIPIDKVKLLTEQELNDYRQKQEVARQEKLKKEAEEKARKEAELKAKQEAERKAKEEMELKERQTAAEKARLEAENKTKIESEVLDKYIWIQVDNANLRSAPKKSSPIITRAKEGESFKLVWIESDDDNTQWYQVNVPSGKQIIKAYIHSSLAKAVTKEELDKITKSGQPIAPLPPATTAAAETATAEQKAKAETDAKILSSIEDKYVLILINNTNIRTAPDKSASLITKASIDEAFKVTWIKKDRVNTPWYQISISTGTQLIDGYVISTLTKLITKQQLGEYRFTQEQAALNKAKKEAEQKARLEAEQKAKAEKLRLESEAKVRQEAERKLQLEKQAADLKAQQEEKARLEVLRQAQEAQERAQKEAELKAKLEAEKLQEEEWLKDKYVLVQYKDTNIRKTASKNATVVQKAQLDQDFKIVSRGKEWYEIALSTGTAYIHNTVVKVISGTELTALRQQQEETRLEKLKKEAEEKAKKEAELKAKQEVLRQAQEAKELAQKEADRKAKLAKEEKERLAREAAELKVRQEAEARAKEQEWIKDKYVIITTNNTNLRQAPYKNASIITKAKTGDVFKLKARGKEWHELLKPPDQVVFVMTSRVQVMSETEVQAKAEAERLAKEESARKAKEEAEQKKREAAELKARQEAEEKARLEAYIKDKYILITLDSTNLRNAPDKNSTILAKANSDVSFKVTWISPDKQNVPWYQIAVPSGTSAFQAYVVSTLAKLVTVQELNDHRLAQQKEAEEKARIAREAADLKARQEAELKAKQEAAILAKEEADRKAKELHAAAELAKQQEKEQKKREAEELKARQEAERRLKLEAEKLQEEEWLKDKYVLVQYKDANIRKTASKNATVVQKVQLDQDFKIVSRGKEWYEIALSTGTAYIHNTVVKVISGTELTALRQQQEETRLEKLKKEAEEKAKKEAQLIARLEAEQKAREEKLLLEAEAKTKAAAELIARQEAESKAKLEAERKAKEAEEVKAKIEAEAKSKMEAYVKDKYIVISDNNAVIRTAPNIRAKVLHVAEENETFKLSWIRDDWYEIKVPSGPALVTGYVDVPAARSMTLKELATWQKLQEQERLLREAEELKAQQDALRKAKEETAAKQAQLDAERLAKQEAEQKAREEAELKAKQEAEAKLQEEEWLKDKYVLVQYKDTNIRKTADKNAAIVQKAQLAQDFKIVSRGKEWYEIALSTGTAYIHDTVVKVISGAELAAFRQQQEAERKAKLEVLRQAQEAERQSKLEKEEKLRLEAEAKARLEVLRQAQEAQEQALKEAERKAKLEKAEEDREDLAEYSYIVINAPYAEIRAIPDTAGQSLLIALKGDVFKYNGQQKGWYHITTFSGETRFVRKSLCRGSNTAPQLPAKESARRDIYDTLIDAKDRAMTDTNARYPSVKSQAELQEKIFYQQTVEEKFILEIFHKYKIQPATYLTLLSEAISKNW